MVFASGEMYVLRWRLIQVMDWFDDTKVTEWRNLPAISYYSSRTI